MARVLVVEDDATVAELVAARLRAAGHKVRVVRSGAEAVEAFGGGVVPEVVVLDVGLPDEDGYSLLEHLRRSAGTGFGAVFLSAGVTEDRIERGTAMGATYLTKPFIASALIKAVERAMETAAADAGW